MKNLVKLFVFTLSVLVLASCGKEKAEDLFNKTTPEQREIQNFVKGYIDDSHLNERGTWGCGIPCPGVQLPPMDSVCVMPNGICALAESVGPIDPDIQSELNMVELQFLSAEKIRFVRLSASEIDQEALKQTVLSYLTEEYVSYLGEIVNYITNHVNIPKDMPFSDQDAQFLLSNAGLEGNSISLLEGEYKIITTEEYPFGYFDVSIAIQ